MLAQSGHEPRPSMPVGRPATASINIQRLDTRNSKHWPGRNPKQQHGRGVFSEGHDTNHAIGLSVTWRFVWTEVVLKITTQKTTYKTFFFRSLCKLLEPRPQC